MNLEQLRAAWHRASEKDQPTEAVKALVELEKLEPEEARWSQRLGEAYRRLGRDTDAALAFTRAHERYFARGFLPRAIAMAKLVRVLDPARGDLLERSLAESGPGVPPPLAFGRPVGKPPAPLEPAVDSVVEEEVRFEDAPESSLEILLEDLTESETVVTIDVGDSDVEVAPESEPAGSVDAYSSLASIRLFASLSREALLSLANAAELAELVESAMVIVRGERAFALYAIISGAARVIVDGRADIRLREGDVFGEGTLLDDGTRQADVRAETQLMVLRIDKRVLDEVMRMHPEVETVLFDLLARRLISNLMHRSPLFAAFEPPVRLDLAQKFEVRRAAAGTVLAERGRRSDGLYVLLSGQVLAEPAAGEATRIARGAAFGHASLLGPAPSDVTIHAATEAVLLRLPAAGFAALAAQYPPVLALLAETAHEPLPASRRDP